MNKKKVLKIDWLEVGLLAGIVVVAFILRTVWQWDDIFVNDTVLFRGTDPWYHMRMVDNTIANFPNPVTYDPYIVYPGGSKIGFYPLLSFTIAFFGWLGLNADFVGAILPPIVGSLILVPVYLIGRELFGKTGGLLSALFTAIIPGELFHRSMLGHTDHHVLESLFLTSACLFYILAVRRNWKFCLPAGLSVGLYMLNWSGGPFLLLMLWIWYVTYFIFKTLKDKETWMLSKIIFLSSIMAFLVPLPFYLLSKPDPIVLVAFFGFIGSPLGLEFLKKIVKNKSVFPWVVSTLLLAGVVLVQDMFGNLFRHFRDSIVMPFSGFGSSIQELLPTDWTVAFNIYGIFVLFFFGGLFLCIKKKSDLLLIVWSLLILLMTFGQRRWGYYFTVNVALLSALFIIGVSEYVKKNVRLAVVIVFIIFSVLSTIKGTIGLANLPNSMTYEWYEAMMWVRDNTESSFINDPYYLHNSTEKPRNAVLTWWDYGHWIIRIGHRMPTSNPASWGVIGMYRFFTEPDEAEANKILDEARVKIKYVIVDSLTAGPKFPSMIAAVGKEGLDWREELPKSMVYRLYSGEAINRYKLIYESQNIKIFERS